jgi:hypothetical protein
MRRAENWFVAAQKGNLFVRWWHDVYLEFWKDKTNCFGAGKHALLQPVGKLIISNGLAPSEDLGAYYSSQMLACSRVMLLKGL